MRTDKLKLHMKTLVVGQEVILESGCYHRRGIVVEITPKDFSVQTCGEIIVFDNNGQSRAETREGGPWRLLEK